MESGRRLSSALVVSYLLACEYSNEIYHTEYSDIDYSNRAAYHLIRSLPVNPKTLPQQSSPHTHTRPQTGACTFPALDTRPHALESSLAAGCDRLRTAVWMHDGELQVGNAVAGSNSKAVPDRLGLDPLLAELDEVTAEAPDIVRV